MAHSSQQAGMRLHPLLALPQGAMRTIDAPLLISLLGLGAAFFAPAANADDGRFQDYAVGAHALGLGGAFGAISDDASGVFYNPAGIVDTPRPRASISTSIYGLELNGATPVDSAVLRFERGFTAADLIIVPSSTGAVIGVGDRMPSGAFRHAVAFGTQVPQFSSRFQDALSPDPVSQLQTRVQSSVTDRTLHAGAAYAWRVSPWLRLGATAHYIFRSTDADESVQAVSTVDPSRLLIADTTLRATHHALRLGVGAKLVPGPRWSFGLTVQSPSLGVWGTTQFSTILVDSIQGEGDARVLQLDQSVFDPQSQLPATLRLAMAYHQPKSFLIAVDVTGYAPSSYSLLPNQLLNENAAQLTRVPIPLRIQRGPVANINVGGEFVVTSEISISAGVFTNFSGAPAIETDANGFVTNSSSRLSNLQMVGGSFAVALSGDQALHRIGITGSSGFGRIVEPAPVGSETQGRIRPLQAVDASRSLVFLFWASTFQFGETSTGRGLAL